MPVLLCEAAVVLLLVLVLLFAFQLHEMLLAADLLMADNLLLRHFRLDNALILQLLLLQWKMFFNINVYYSTILFFVFYINFNLEPSDTFKQM